MKVFLFYTCNESRQTRMGNRYKTLSVSEMIDNVPYPRGTLKICMGAMRGTFNEVMYHLAKEGHIPSEYKSGHYNFHENNLPFQIHEI